MALLLDLLVAGQTRLNDDTYAKNIYADKFIRTGSSDLYVLLGGGGHKLLSDFSMAHEHPYLPLAGGWMDYAGQIYFKGLNQSTSTYATIGYRSSLGGSIMHHESKPYQNSGAFYIATNGCDSANDWGGLAIDNEGVTVFGAGDTGSIFRVLNEDNVSGGAQFYVTKAAGAVVKRSLAASNFVSNTATGTQPYACTSNTLNTNLNADLLDGKHASDFATASHTHPYLPLSGGTLSGGITFKYGSNNTDQFIQFSSTDSSDPQTVYLGIRRPLSSYGPCYKDNNGNWYNLIHSGNYTTYTVKKDGTGASGTWGINITGNSATATRADTVDGYHFSDLESRYVNVTGDTMSGRLNIGVESSGNANPLCLYHSNIKGAETKGKSVGIRLGHEANSYYARIAAIFESQNPDYLRPCLAFYTMDSTYQENTESERMRISAAGNVGIGTTTPGYKLDVNGTTYLRNDTIIGNKSKFYQRGTRGAVHYEIVGDDADYGVMKIRHTSTEGSGSPGSYTATLTIQDERANTISGSYEPTFYIKRTGATYVPDLVGVNNSVGRVFTIAPYGNIFTGNRSIDNTAFTNSITIFANQSNEGSNQTFDTSKSSWGITFKRQWSSNEQNSTSAGIYAVGMSNWRTGLAFRVKNNTTGTNGTHDTTSMWMAPNGNIGIGTTNPSSYKLEVNGDTYSTGYVRAASGFVKGSSSNDYVLLGGGGHKAISDFSMSHSHPYLPLAGGYMDQGSHVIFPGTSTDTNYGGSIEFREVNYVTTSQTDWSYAPGITFHWGGYTVGKLGLRSDGNLAWRDQSIIHSGNIGSQSVNYANSAGTSSNSDKLDNIDSTGFLAWTGMSASGGSSAPFQTSVDFFNNTENLNAGARMIYNCPGSEYTILYTRRSDATGHGSILRWGYPDNYIRMIRMISGSPQTSDWEKISAGYADSAGSVAWSGITGKPSSFTPSSHSHDYLPLSGGTMTGAISLSNTNAKLAFGSLTTSPVTGYKAPSLQSNGVGIYSRYGGSSDEGAIIITEDTCVIYNSADTGWNFQVMDKDLGTDMTNDATRSFGVNQNHQAWSLAGFVKSGSSDSYVLLGGGGHKALSDFSMSHSHPYLPLSGGTCTGNIYAPAFYESSDERLKDFYNSIDVDLDKLSSLPKKFFKWKSNPNGEFEIGTSAQELQKIYPQLVNTDDKGYLTVAYDKLSIIALRAIDKLYEMNKNLERRIQILESKQ